MGSSSELRGSVLGRALAPFGVGSQFNTVGCRGTALIRAKIQVEFVHVTIYERDMNRVYLTSKAPSQAHSSRETDFLHGQCEPLLSRPL
jgi:hypothetical protein